MLNIFDDLQKLGQNNLDASVNSFSALAKSAQTIATEMTEYSKKTFEEGGKAMGELLIAKTPEQAIEIQTEFAKAAFERYLAELTKINDLCVGLAKKTFKSLEPVAKAASRK